MLEEKLGAARLLLEDQEELLTQERARASALEAALDSSHHDFSLEEQVAVLAGEKETLRREIEMLQGKQEMGRIEQKSLPRWDSSGPVRRSMEKASNGEIRACLGQLGYGTENDDRSFLEEIMAQKVDSLPATPPTASHPACIVLRSPFDLSLAGPWLGSSQIPPRIAFLQEQRCPCKQCPPGVRTPSCGEGG